MTNQFLSTCIIILLSLCFSSCDQEDDTDDYYFNTSQFSYNCIDETIEFFNDGNNIFSYTCDGEWIELFLDIIWDESNEIEGTWPNLDTYRVYVDIDNNEVLDERIDFMLAKSNNGDICKFYLLSQSSSSPCAHAQNIVVASNFSETENSSEKHYNVKFTLGKHHLSYSSQASLVIQIHDPETGWKRYPSEQELFTDSFVIDL